MFLSQYNQLQKIKIDSIVDINIHKAKENCKKSGLSEDTIKKINFQKKLDEILDRDIDVFIAQINPLQRVGTKHVLLK